MNIFDKALVKAMYLYYSKWNPLGSRIGPEEKSQANAVLSTYREQIQLPKNQFNKDGFEVVPSFISPETCEFLRERFDHYLHDELPPEEKNVYIVERRRQPLDSYDRNVFQLMNINNLPEMSELCDSLREKIEKLFLERTGLKLYCNSFSLQRDFADDESKRPYHTDGFGMTFKAFIYLTDVPEPKNGPYTVIPGSHRDLFKRLRNVHLNVAANHKRSDDFFRVYDDRHAVRFCKPKGTMILSNQMLAHKGWHEHTEGTRDIIVVYIQPKPETNWTLGKHIALREPLKKMSPV